MIIRIVALWPGRMEETWLSRILFLWSLGPLLPSSSDRPPVSRNRERALKRIGSEPASYHPQTLERSPKPLSRDPQSKKAAISSISIFASISIPYVSMSPLEEPQFVEAGSSCPFPRPKGQVPCQMGGLICSLLESPRWLHLAPTYIPT